MALCSYVERRRQRYYFRVRLPSGIGRLLGQSHVIASLVTRDPGAAKIRAARMYLVVAAFLTTLIRRMSDHDHIEAQGDCAAGTLARTAFELGCHYRADAEALRQHYNAALRRLIRCAQNEWKLGAGSGRVSNDVEIVWSGVSGFGRMLISGDQIKRH